MTLRGLGIDDTKLIWMSTRSEYIPVPVVNAECYCTVRINT